MIRRTLGASALLLLVASLPLSAQVIGHLPSESPYEDVTGRHMIGLQAGFFLPTPDPAGVSHESGLAYILRYEYDVTGPILLMTRVAFAPGLNRPVKDPLLTGPARDAGTRKESIVMFDVGVVLSLTGDKSWRGYAPRAYGNLGIASGVNSDYDVGGYRFGPKFVPSYGLAVRRVTESKWEWFADVNHLFWKMNYPNEYTDNGSTVEPSIIGNTSKSPWNANFMLTIGITRVWGR